MKPKVLYIGGLDSGQRGAVGTHTSGIILGFLEQGVELHGIFLDGQLPNTLPEQVTIVPASKVPGRVGKTINLTKIALQARKKRSQYDIVYTRFDPFLSPFVCNSNTILEYNDDVLAQVKFVAKLGGYSKFGQIVRSLIYPWFIPASERLCFRKSNKVICVTKGLVDVVSHREPGVNAVFLPNASSAKYFPALARDSKDTKLRLGHIGTLTHWDGLLELIESIDIFIKNNPRREISLDIVGSGSLIDELKEQIRKRSIEEYIFIHPPVSHAEAIQILHTMDVVPLLKTISVYGLSPIKYYEALCTGRFLICSDICHINEVSEEQGRVVKFPLDPIEISRVLEEVYDDLKIIRQSAPARAVSAQLEHSWSARIASLLNGA